MPNGALQAALDDHHHQRGDQRLGQSVRGRRGGKRGQSVPPLPLGQDNRQVLQAVGPAEGRVHQAVTEIDENTLAQPVKPPLRERRACLAKLVKSRLTLALRRRVDVPHRRRRTAGDAPPPLGARGHPAVAIGPTTAEGTKNGLQGHLFRKGL